MDDALSLIEQRCQVMRWRLATFPNHLVAEGMKAEIDALALEVINVARLHCELGGEAG